MPKYLKDKKIIIADDTKPIHPGKLWAYYRQLDVKKVEEIAGIVISPEKVLFVINWRDDVCEGMNIKFRDTVYAIIRVDDYEGYRQDLHLYCGNVAYRIDIEEYQGE